MVKVSVIVPIYNTEKFLKKCLDSLVNQTLKEIEIILINDGSPDNSEEICLTYLERYRDIIKYFKIKNGGCSNARNFGISKATGKYIMFVDSDDYVDLEFCRKMYEEIEIKKLDLVSCNFKLVDLEDKILEFKKLKNSDEKDELKILLNDDDFSGFIVNKIFRKDFIKNKKIFFLKNTHMFEDKAFVIKYLLETKKVKHIPDNLYYYVTNPNSVMLKVNLDRIKDIFISLDYIKKELFAKNTFYTEEYRKYLYNTMYINRGLIQPLKMIEKAYVKSSFKRKELNELTSKIFERFNTEKIKISRKKICLIKFRIFLCKYFSRVIKLINK